MFEDYTVVKKYYLNNHTIDSINGDEATNNGVTFEQVSDFTPQSTIDLLENKKYIDESGNVIINPQFSLPSGWTEVPAGYYPKGYFLDFNPTEASSIGEIAWILFDRGATTGNVEGKPEIWDGDATFVADTDPENLHLWDVDNLTEDYILAHINTDYKKFMYALIKSEVFKNILVYGTQLTDTQNNKLVNLKYIPDYV